MRTLVVRSLAPPVCMLKMLGRTPNPNLLLMMCQWFECVFEWVNGPYVISALSSQSRLEKHYVNPVHLLSTLGACEYRAQPV